MSFVLVPQNIDLLTFLNDNPLHVVAQTVAKVSILMINDWVGLPVLVLVVLTLFNVRSSMVAFFLAFLANKYKWFLSWKGLLFTRSRCKMAPASREALPALASQSD
jgi:hypothetical protein